MISVTKLSGVELVGVEFLYAIVISLKQCFKASICIHFFGAWGLSCGMQDSCVMWDLSLGCVDSSRGEWA